MSDIKSFYIHEIGGLKCNINYSSEELHLLTSFEHLFLHYENGNFLLKMPDSKNQNKINEIILSNTDAMADALYIDNSSDMSNEEYFMEVAGKKNELIRNIVKNIWRIGFEKPSTVQSISIIPLIQSRDTLVQFKAGTGKTLAFCIGICYSFDPNNDTLQILVITSSHEIAKQIYDIIRNLLPEKTRVVLCVGIKKDQDSINRGSFISKSADKSLREQIDEAKGAQVIVGTIGKIHDFIKKKFINTNYLKVFCNDEFDQIVVSNSRKNDHMNTSDQLKYIIETIPQFDPIKQKYGCQRVFFSATITQKSVSVAKSYFRYSSDGNIVDKIGEPLICLLDINDNLLDGISQYYVSFKTYHDKIISLQDILSRIRFASCIVFVNTKINAMKVQEELLKCKIPFDSTIFHGDLLEAKRREVIDEFLKGKYRILIATDVLSRGIDITSINLVINFDMPNEISIYTHRIGRCGRFGKKGSAINFIVVNESENIDEMQKIDSINNLGSNVKMGSKNVKILPQNFETII